ncbi:hypothetical protein LSTR_LSTR000039 [Laodelphax striatellus]|uniref:Uncharacterized protein n=1 Tax=Laodelphax striatellus TaxID=195883 RepID=A0A482X5Z2_LAOST|nr:hypothetical protein LSTR_LSTR000039 [Laodelphax striatellus]
MEELRRNLEALVALGFSFAPSEEVLGICSSGDSGDQRIGTWCGLDPIRYPELDKELAGKEYQDILEYLFTHPESAKELWVHVGDIQYPAFQIKNLFQDEIHSSKFLDEFCKNVFLKYRVNVYDYRQFYDCVGNLKFGINVNHKELNIFTPEQLIAGQKIAIQQQYIGSEVELKDQIGLVVVDESLSAPQAPVPESVHCKILENSFPAQAAKVLNEVNQEFGSTVEQWPTYEVKKINKFEWFMNYPSIDSVFHKVTYTVKLKWGVRSNECQTVGTKP